LKLFIFYFEVIALSLYFLFLSYQFLL